jgi:3',5'-cyclic-AMP phosphodiesterase
MPPHALRLAHLTDIHVQPERGADLGLEAALDHALSLSPRPDLILSGGDAIMNATGESSARIDQQWALWHQAWRRTTGTETFHCLGNHDCRLWDANDGTATAHKRRAIAELGMPGRYYSFDRGGWHFAVLDSCQPLNGGYTAGLDPAQWQWFQQDLSQAGDTPVVVVSHVPILSVTGPVYDDQRLDGHHWRVPGDWMHTDAYRLQALFQQYPNVRLCLSGHMHLRDRCEFNGVTYICDGAVCANWWSGDLEQCDEGYGLIDLYTDGSFDYRYTGFDWEPRP